MTTEERRRRRFSEEFRQKRVVEIENGLSTLEEVSLKYEVKKASVKRWLLKYGKTKLPKQIIVHDSSELNLLKDLKTKIKEYESIIGQQQIKILHLEEIVDQAKISGYKVKKKY